MVCLWLDKRREAGMAGPFIFIGTHRLKEGKLGDFAAAWRNLVAVVEASEPQMIAFNAYANEAGTEVAVVQVHPDAASMELHMQVVREHITSAYEELLEETTSIQVFGEFSDPARGMMEHLAGSGVALTVKVNELGGFTRSSA
jgi:hypothetical protein